MSEVKPKKYKRHFITKEYDLEGYDIEVLNIGEHNGRGKILYIHNLLQFQIHQFDVEFNEAQFCTLTLRGKDTLLTAPCREAPVAPPRIMTTSIVY